jgi:metal-dependent hydrolase (beta-lactamase superfamily II)
MVRWSADAYVRFSVEKLVACKCTSRRRSILLSQRERDRVREKAWES